MMKRLLFSGLGQVIVLLVCIQLARALVAYALRFVAQPDGNVVLFQISNALSFILVGVAMLILRRPSLTTLGLDFNSGGRREKAIYVFGGFAVLTLIAISLMLDVRENWVNLHFAIVVPLFEELLFRGYVWSKIKSVLPENANGSTLIIVTLLFAFWHIGYLDSFLSIPLAVHGITLPFLLMSKIIIGLVLGTIAGFARWQSGKVFGPVLIHALWNLFA